MVSSSYLRVELYIFVLFLSNDDGMLRGKKDEMRVN